MKLVAAGADDAGYTAMVKKMMGLLPPPAYAPPALPAPVQAPVQAQAPAPGPPPAAHPAPRAPAQQRAQQPSFFLGQPIAPLLVGTDICIDIQGGRPCLCPVSVAFPDVTIARLSVPS